jgi:uncharacterized protein YndB with AHSA1/START domain
MPHILYDFPINAPIEKVFSAISTAEGLNQWWTKRSSAEQKSNGIYELSFGHEYDWRGKVTKWNPNSDFEFEIFNADKDWNGTLVGFHLKGKDGITIVEFYHKNWPEENEHFRISSFCWAMYLRILKRYVEFGETVPYEKRLDV